jgi:hypothetical protein
MLLFDINCISCISFVGFPPQLQRLAVPVRLRLASAFRPSTQASHRLACITLALFCLHFHTPFPHVSLPVLLSFLQFLTLNSLSVPTIKNYLSSIKSKFRQVGLPLAIFSSPQLSLFITSLEKNSNYSSSQSYFHSFSALVSFALYYFSPFACLISLYFFSGLLGHASQR